jgi:hypothetical protein
LKKTVFGFVALLGVLAIHDLWAIQQFIPDAVVEEYLLKEVDEATREGEILRLQTDLGTVTFEVRTNAEEGYVKYYLVDRLKPAQDHYYLVRAIGYEGAGYLLVCQKTGQTISLFGPPVFSPDGQRFVDVSLDLDAGYHPNLIGIYKMDADKYAIEWSHAYEGMKGPANPVWLDNTAIVFFEVTFDKVPTVANLKKSPFIIEWENNKWNTPRPLR